MQKEDSETDWARFALR